MTIDYELTPRRLRRVRLGPLRDPRGGRTALWRVHYGMTLAFLFPFVVGRIVSPTPGDFVWLAFAALWFLLMPAFQRMSGRRSVRQLAERGLWRGAVGPHRMTIDERGIINASPHYENRTLWSGIERIVRLPDRVLIYVGHDSALQVPRRAFPSDAGFDAWIERLEAGVHGSRASTSRSV